MATWSKLQKRLYLLFDPKINLQIQCRLVRMDSRRGSTDIPRYWMTLDKEVIWDYPGQFKSENGTVTRADSHKVVYYPHQTDVSLISELIREYIDTPECEILSKQFDNDHWGLVNILRAADRRIGLRRWKTMEKKTHNAAALKVLQARQMQRPHCQKTARVRTH